MKKLILIGFIFSIFSCNKDNPSFEDQHNEDEFICSDCLKGEWELIEGLKMIGNDTLQVFENNQINDFWYGVREPYKYNSHLFLTINDNNFYYDEFIAEYINGEDNILTYNDNFKWLNTYVSKTHLKIRMRFNFNNDVDIFKIKKVTDSDLELEHIQGWYGNFAFYMSYKFKRKDTTQIINQNHEPMIGQTPNNITGLWKLDDFLERDNDSVFARFINDTLIYQYYEYTYLPPHYTKVIYKTAYNLSVKLEDYGVFNGIEWNNGVYRNIVGYWFWTDEPNPHAKIYIEPTISNFITDYDLIQLDDNTMSLQLKYHKFENDTTTQVIFYKFKKQ